MKKITFFMMKSCPYCIAAARIMDELFTENPEYQFLEIEKIDERVHPDIAKKYDYFYVPTFYVGDVKMHEGAADYGKIKRVFEAALRES